MGSVIIIPVFCATETALVSILLKHFLPSRQLSKEFRLLFRNVLCCAELAEPWHHECAEVEKTEEVQGEKATQLGGIPMPSGVMPVPAR